jgi:LmbE family N-acetylglucosaminyl deacetylase
MGTQPADILVITPHPDDAEFGAAGSVAGMIRRGKSAVYVVVTNGDKGTDDPDLDPAELVRIREEEQREAAGVLGVREVVFLGYPDQGIEETPELRKDIVRQIRLFRPRLVITSDPYRRYIWHRDHRITGRVVLDAVFPYARDPHSYPDLIEEGLDPHKVPEVWLWASNEADINFRSDITDTFDLKVKALRCHKSQIKEPFSSEMEKWLCQRAKDMAKGVDFKLAEAFHRAEVWW